MICRIVKLKFQLKSIYQEMECCQTQIMKVSRQVIAFEHQYKRERGEAFVLTQSSIIPTCYGLLFKLKVQEMSLRYQLNNLEQEMYELIEQADHYLTFTEKVQLLGGGMERAYRAMNHCYRSGVRNQNDEVTMMDLVMFRTEFIKETPKGKISSLHRSWEILVFTACLSVILKPSNMI